MKTVEEILAEIEKRIFEYQQERTHHDNDISIAELAALKHFITTPATECEHEEIQHRLDARGYHFKCKKCDKHLRIEKYGS